jgi:hypothetical protein
MDGREWDLPKVEEGMMGMKIECSQTHRSSVSADLGGEKYRFARGNDRYKQRHATHNCMMPMVVLKCLKTESIKERQPNID